MSNKETSDQYRHEVLKDMGQAEYAKTYKGHYVRVLGSNGSLQITIDGQRIPGNFTGVSTAYQRACTLIDRGEV